MGEIQNTFPTLAPVVPRGWWHTFVKYSNQRQACFSDSTHVGGGFFDRWLYLSLQDSLKEVPVAMRFLFGAMTQECYGGALAQSLQKPEGEFLPMIFDGGVASVEGSGFAQLFQVTVAERAPADQTRLEFPQQLLARAEARHPDIIARHRHAASTKPGDQDAQPVLARFNRGKD